MATRQAAAEEAVALGRRPTSGAFPWARPEQELSDSGLAVFEQVARLAREQFAPRAAAVDADGRFPRENYADLREAGLLALTIPECDGGLGADPLTYVLCLLEIARACPSTALTFNMHSTVVAQVGALASDEQRAHYFGEVVRNGKVFASITSEPGGSFRGAFQMGTAVEPVPGGYRIHGIKHFCSIGDAADYFFVSGILEGTESAHEGLVTALVPRHTPGVTVEGEWNAAGMRGTNSQTIRYDCVVDPFAIVGRPGQWLTIDLTGYALGYAAVYLGVGEAAFQFIVEHFKQRATRQGSDEMLQHPTNERTVAEMATSLRSARLMLIDAAHAVASGEKQSTMLAVNQAKYLGAEVGATVTAQALRLAGGTGILKSMPLERWHRDALAGPVMPPANDRCLETIGRIVFGLDAATLEFK